MKSIVKLLVPLVALTLIFTTQVFARNITAEDTVLIAKSETIDDDLFIGADSVTIEGTINGDVYVGGGTITVRGTINGDLLAGGGTIDISGVISQSVRVAGGNIFIHQAKIGKSLNTFGGNVNVDQDTTVGGTAVFGAGMFSSEAKIERNLLGGGGSVNIGGSIGRSADIGGDVITLKPQAKINGSLTYFSENAVEMQDGAMVVGESKQIHPDMDKNVSNKVAPFMDKIDLGFSLWVYLSTLIVGLVFVRFFPLAADSMSQRILSNPWSCLGWGFIVLFLSPIAIGLLFLSIIGIPLGMIAIVLYMIEIYISPIFVAIIFGQILFDSIGKVRRNTYAKLIVGLLIYSLLVKLPLVGFFVMTGSIFLGLGAIFTYKRQRLFKNA
jgi:hypothetical protein